MCLIPVLFPPMQYEIVIIRLTSDKGLAKGKTEKVLANERNMLGRIPSLNQMIVRKGSF